MKVSLQRLVVLVLAGLALLVPALPFDAGDARTDGERLGVDPMKGGCREPLGRVWSANILREQNNGEAWDQAGDCGLGNSTCD